METATALSYKVFTEHETSRMIFEGAVNSDIVKVFSNTKEEKDWIVQWKSLAGEEADLAKNSEEERFIESAFQGYIRAANYYRLAQYHLLSENQINIKRENLLHSYKYYRKAIGLKPYLFKTIAVEHDGMMYNGYIHLPHGFDENKKYPCALVIPGLGHNRESVHNFCQQGGKTGIVVISIDGPGYGESVTFSGMKVKIAEFYLFIEKVINNLQCIEYIDTNRTGIIGDCFGGYLAYLSAIRLKSIKSCAMLEAILEYGEDQIRNKPLPPILTFHIDPNDLQSVSTMNEDFNTNPADHTFSLYLLHTQTDRLIPFETAKRVYDHFTSDKFFDIVEDEQVYQNYLINHYNAVLDNLEKYVPRVWDWMKLQLS